LKIKIKIFENNGHEISIVCDFYEIIGWGRRVGTSDSEDTDIK
jgi:hypothetical protein